MMNEPASLTPHDFDTWARLAATDRTAFEDLRQQVIETAIDRAPARKRQRLRCLQWKLDRIRQTARTPMVACLRMQRLLWESVAGDSGLLACLQYTTDARQHPGNGDVTTAEIIPFRR